MTFSKQEQTGDAARKQSGRYLLLIEDSRVFSTLIRHEIQNGEAMTVTHCASLGDVTRALECQSFDVAVLDLNLPDAPNCEALDLVLSHGIPAIVFTGSFNDSTRERVMARGVVDCIIKNKRDSVSSVVAAVNRMLSNAGTNVLVADDDAERRQALASILREQRFQVTEVTTGQDVLSAVLEGRVDLVISEYASSELSAQQLLVGLRSYECETTVPIIAMAPQSARGQAARFLKGGGADFVERPFDRDEFISRINRSITVNRRIASLERLASRDYLTDLYNRRFFFQEGPPIVEQCFRRNAGSSIAILDIDHFKRLNDTFGHEVGDLVLKAVARTLRNFVGNDHLLARLGGEEFGVLFDGLDISAATLYCEQLRETIARTQVVTDDEDLSVTVSIGLAPIEQREVFDNYLHAADQFLYMAKHAGRNRIVSELTMINTMAS
ncbi:sensor domain-containing diguanylate cyclase [Rhizobium sp. 9140]|uniref:sensor domain-containing diguanylate cyclase n=1 Tax=Rhizobium sp. 9140 TaxID=1761900 RepID=UPI000793A23F|nr:diguanylate cyclase [Rhizobium sp. 9140]CZT35501.1 diguanylate cyclase (GGDEF) domain-containing protein [Rhizobium sp. 9140]